MNLVRASSILAICVAAVCCGAQEVKYADVVGVTQRTTLRTVPPPPPKCDAQGNCASGGGFGGGSVGDCSVGSREPRALRTTITWTDENSYVDGSPAIWEMKIENAGSTEVEIPISPHLADLQPNDPSKPFKYAEIGLTSYIPQRTSMADFGYVLLYGTHDQPETILSLRPGEWVRVRAGTMVRLQPNRQSPTVIQGSIQAGFWIHNVTYTSRPEGSSSAAMGVCPRTEQGSGPVIRVEPIAKNTNAPQPGTTN